MAVWWHTLAPNSVGPAAFCWPRWISGDRTDQQCFVLQDHVAKAQVPGKQQVSTQLPSPAGNTALLLARRQPAKAALPGGGCRKSGVRIRPPPPAASRHAGVSQEHEDAVVSFRAGEMIKNRIEICIVHRPRYLKYHTRAMLVSDVCAHTHQPGARERRADQESTLESPADSAAQQS